MASKVPLWFEIVFFGFLLFFLVGFIFATWQQKKFAREAEYWPVVNAVVVERICIGNDPTNYEFRVKYDFNGIEHLSVAKNFFEKSSTNKYVGDNVAIKVDPQNPASSVLFS